MKRFLYILAACSLLMACRLLSPGISTAMPTKAPDLLRTSWADRAIFSGGLAESQRAVLNELPGASVYHLEFTILDDLYHVQGMEQVRYTNQETVPLDEIQFRLFPNILGGEMTVTTLSVDSQPVAPKYGLSNSLMRVPLVAPLQPGASAIVHMQFAVTVPQTPEANYGVLASTDGVLTLAHAYPMIAVYDDEGWNAEIPPQYGDLTYTDTAFYLARLRAPQGLVLVSSGRRVQQVTERDEQVATFAAGPARDFFAAASSDYKEAAKTIGGVTIHSYAPSKLKEGAELALEAAAKAIGAYSDLYAPYPYTEFDLVSTPTLALGVEYPGVVAIAQGIYDVHSTIGGAPASIYLESTVAHEVGHQWFYNLVGSDQLDEPWLDESLAQFATLEYFTEEYGSQGGEGFRASLEGRWDRINDAEIPIGLPVAAYSEGEYSGIVYGRGPLFFEALEAQMGEQGFNQFLKDYARTYSWGIATTEEFKSLAEKDCGCDLTPLFKEWVYPPR